MRKICEENWKETANLWEAISETSARRSGIRNKILMYGVGNVFHTMKTEMQLYWRNHQSNYLGIVN
jgi:hypothetical protein